MSGHANLASERSVGVGAPALAAGGVDEAVGLAMAALHVGEQLALGLGAHGPGLLGRFGAHGGEELLCRRARGGDLPLGGRASAGERVLGRRRGGGPGGRPAPGGLPPRGPDGPPRPPLGPPDRLPRGRRACSAPASIVSAAAASSLAWSPIPAASWRARASSASASRAIASAFSRAPSSVAPASSRSRWLCSYSRAASPACVFVNHSLTSWRWRSTSSGS